MPILRDGVAPDTMVPAYHTAIYRGEGAECAPDCALCAWNKAHPFPPPAPDSTEEPKP